MEIETVMNYMANSINLDGVRAEQIKQALAADINEEVLHAQQLGRRIKQLGGLLPGSEKVALGHQPQPPADTTDVIGVIKGVIAAELSACEQYHKIIEHCGHSDPVTADLCTRLLADEEEHLVLFRGFLKEYERDHHAG
jgi:bacterioferritin